MINEYTYIKQGDTLIVNEFEAEILFDFFNKNNIHLNSVSSEKNIINFPSSYVGYINFPSRKVIINPRHEGVDLRHIIRMYFFVHGVDEMNLDNRIFDLDNFNIEMNLVQLFITELMNVIRVGLPVSYINVNGDLLYLKGKLNVRNTFLNMEKAKRDVFNCEYDSLTLDNEINRILLAALDKISDSVQLPEVNFLKRHFRGVTPIDNINTEKKIYLDKRTDYCRKAIDLSYMILNKIFFFDTGANSYGEGFLINYDMLFEDFIKTVLIYYSNDFRFTFWHGKKTYGQYNMNDRSYIKEYIPDLLYDFTDQYPYKAGAILDAKNKYSSPFANQDVFQMLFYASMLDSSKAILCYPSIGYCPPTMLKVNSNSFKINTIYATFIDISAFSSSRFLDSLHQFISDIFSCL